MTVSRSYKPEKRAQEGSTLFGPDEEFREAYQQWKGMPEFVHQDLEPHRSILVHFANEDDFLAFEKLIDQRIRRTSKIIMQCWFPKAQIGHRTDKRYVTDDTPEDGGDDGKRVDFGPGFTAPRPDLIEDEDDGEAD